MPKNIADTLDQYLAELPSDSRQALGGVRDIVLKHLPEGCEEPMLFGMISYVVPVGTFSVTYDKQPLTYASLTSQKNHMAIYLMIVCRSKACLWFKKLRVALDVRLPR